MGVEILEMIDHQPAGERILRVKNGEKRKQYRNHQKEGVKLMEVTGKSQKIRVKFQEKESKKVLRSL